MHTTYEYNVLYNSPVLQNNQSLTGQTCLLKRSYSPKIRNLHRLNFHCQNVQILRKKTVKITAANDNISSYTPGISMKFINFSSSIRPDRYENDSYKRVAFTWKRVKCWKPEYPRKPPTLEKQMENFVTLESDRFGFVHRW